VAIVAAITVVAACSSTSSSSTPAPTTTPRLRVVATTTVLGDLARAVAGDRADVTTLMGPDDNPHTFVLPPDRQPELDGADLVIQVGRAYEAGLATALDETRRAGTTVDETAPALSPITGADGQPDLHVWTDPDRLTTMADLLADALADRSHSAPEPWQADAARYGATLAAADEAAQAAINPIPDNDRVLASTSDGLTYLAQRYGFTVRAPVAAETALIVDVDALRSSPPGPTTNAELILQTTARIAEWLHHSSSPPG
jgi:ABC-type Zn uptake system ZnuABC Zn-binding protein ZnuA